jgi:hypothetical protein
VVKHTAGVLARRWPLCVWVGVYVCAGARSISCGWGCPLHLVHSQHMLAVFDGRVYSTLPYANGKAMEDQPLFTSIGEGVVLVVECVSNAVLTGAGTRG